MKKLPIGIQSFEAMRSEPHYYVDKTLFVQKLMETGKYYFLSRPRRFGKSLFLDTLRQAFLGKKEYFKDLYLEKNWNWESPHPVLHISFGSGVFRSLEELKIKIESILMDIRNAFGTDYEKTSANDRLMEAIVKISEKTGKKVVVLVDEYDKPILDCIENRELATEIREELKNLYSVFKDADAHLKFVFITGVSKFSKVSLFSGLNHLQDLTLNPDYATLCGYTEKELKTVFQDKLPGLDPHKIQTWYNGYAWLGEKVYNPFDILLYLSEKSFRPFWFETGTPRFLIRLLMQNQYLIPKMENLLLGEEIIDSFDVDRILVEALLFQTGYLTIREVREDLVGRRTYLLDYPNMEVKSSLNRWILNEMVQDVVAKTENENELVQAILENRPSDLKAVFQRFFASIPHDWYRKNQLAGYEGYYASIFYCYFAASGFEVKAEDATNLGRMDMSVFYENAVYIFEFKVIENGSENSAMEQLLKKQYHQKYEKPGTTLFLIAVEFSKEDRNIKHFEMKKAGI